MTRHPFVLSEVPAPTKATLLGEEEDTPGSTPPCTEGLTTLTSTRQLQPATGTAHTGSPGPPASVVLWVFTLRWCPRPPPSGWTPPPTGCLLRRDVPPQGHCGPPPTPPPSLALCTLHAPLSSRPSPLEAPVPQSPSHPRCDPVPSSVGQTECLPHKGAVGMAWDDTGKTPVLTSEAPLLCKVTRGRCRGETAGPDRLGRPWGHGRTRLCSTESWLRAPHQVHGIMIQA